MRRLRLLLFFTLSIFTLFSFVSAQTCSNPSQVILRLSSTTNAHGEVWNGAGNYPVEICYDTLFGQQGNRGTACNTNKIVKLSSQTNAHAEIPIAANYNVNVCYGNLVCRNVAGGASCNSNEREVVSLSGQTNAHLGVAGSYNTGLSYKICCSIPVVSTSSGLDNPIWKYFDSTQISSNALICPNSQIIASVQTGITSGTPVTFRIYDKDTLGDDLITTLSTNVYNNQANITLDLTNPSIRSALQNALNEVFEGNELELYFIANTSSVTNTSYQIRYTNDGSLCSYSNPTSSIIAPVHKGVYFTNTRLNFTSACTSPIGPLRYDWEITQNGQVYHSTESNFTMIFGSTFGNAGQANVRLKCTDIHNNYAKTETQILVVASPYTLAYINDPGFDSFVYSTPTTPYFPNEVRFSASDSFVVDASGCSVSCLGGSCPTQTQNSPLSCGGGPITITNVPSNPVYSGLLFDWRFWDSNWNDPWTSHDGAGVKDGVVLYDDVSNNLNDKHMSVIVTHQASGASATFQRDFTLGRCLNNGNIFYSSNSEPIATNLENNACTGGDGLVGTGDDCCPVGFECSPGNLGYSCKATNNPVTRCEDFTTQNACNSNTNTAIPRASYGQNPAACTFLQCYWVSSTNTCGVRATEYPYNSTTGCYAGTGTCVSDCAWTTSESACTNGRKTISYNSTVISPSNSCGAPPISCDRPSVTVPCGSLNFELSFFGKYQFIASIVFIVAIYYLLHLKRVRKNERSK